MKRTYTDDQRTTISEAVLDGMADAELSAQYARAREGLLAAMGPAVHERVRGSTVVNMTWPSGRGRA